MIDRVADGLGRRLLEVPVGFKWFVPGLLDGSVGFGGEESAGASFLRLDGTVWTTDKDGILLALLASEILAVTGESPGQRYRDLTERHGDPAYARIDAPADRDQKAVLAKLSPEQVTATELAGEPITATLTEAPGNGAPDRRIEGRHGERLVRGPAVGYRGRLQDLRGVVQGPGAPGTGAGGGALARLGRAGHGGLRGGGEGSRGDARPPGLGLGPCAPQIRADHGVAPVRDPWPAWSADRAGGDAA